MSEFLTWATLGTYAGAVLFTTLVTQMLKGISFIDKIPTRLFSYGVALIVLVLATVFSGESAGVADYALCFVNAVIVGLAANGGYDAVKQLIKK